MYVIIAGAGKVGWNLARELISRDQEVTLIESDPRRYRVEEGHLEIIELEVGKGSPVAGRRVQDVLLPDGSLIISVLRDGSGFVPKAASVIQAGDPVMLILDPGLESEV